MKEWGKTGEYKELFFVFLGLHDEMMVMMTSCSGLPEEERKLPRIFGIIALRTPVMG